MGRRHCRHKGVCCSCRRLGRVGRRHCRHKGVCCSCRRLGRVGRRHCRHKGVCCSCRRLRGIGRRRCRHSCVGWRCRRHRRIGRRRRQRGKGGFCSRRFRRVGGRRFGGRGERWPGSRLQRYRRCGRLGSAKGCKDGESTKNYHRHQNGHGANQTRLYRQVHELLRKRMGRPICDEPERGGSAAHRPVLAATGMLMANIGTMRGGDPAIMQ